MKTTVVIADDLLVRLRRQARRENKTLREILDEALREHLWSPAGPPFRLRKHPFRGEGRHPMVTEGQWEAVRDLIYRLG